MPIHWLPTWIQGLVVLQPFDQEAHHQQYSKLDERVFPGLSQSSKSIPLSPEPEVREPEPGRSHRDVQELVGDLPPAIENIPTYPPEDPPALRYSTRECRAPEWFIIDHSRAQRQYREPTPAIESSDEEYNPSQTGPLEIISDSGEESLYTYADMESIINLFEAFEFAFKAGTHSEHKAAWDEYKHLWIMVHGN